MSITIDPQAFYAGGQTFVSARSISTEAILTLTGGLNSSGAMAGSDPAGVKWARQYDQSAAQVLTAAQDVVTGMDHMHFLLTRTGQNYAIAENASALATIGAAATAPMDCPGSTAYVDGAPSLLLATPPSAAGGSSHSPPGWELISSTVGYVWPNGHQDTLRTTAATWRRAGRDVTDARVNAVYRQLSGQRCPELDAVFSNTRTIDADVLELGEIFTAMADSCEQYAQYLDSAHHQIISELDELLRETVAMAVGGALLTVFTAGVSDAAASGAIALRCSATALRVGGILGRLIELAGAAAQAAVNAAARAIELTRMCKLIARLEIAMINPRLSRFAPQLADWGPPALKMSIAQLESKFKHAKVLGVLTNRGAVGFREFGQAITAFLADPATIRVFGTLRRIPKILSYNPVTRLVVIQELDGTFVSCWKMSDEALINVVTRRSLGGGSKSVGMLEPDTGPVRDPADQIS